MPTNLPPQIPSVDEDPFINAQMSAETISVGKPYTAGEDLDMVKVTPISSRPMDAAGNQEMPAVKVYCKKVGDKWLIANMAYTGDHPFVLKNFLVDGMK